MKDQWMASLDIRDFHSLDELRGSLSAFVRSYNLAPHSSLKGKSPQAGSFPNRRSSAVWICSG